MSRRISFSLKTSTAALTRSSVELVSSIASSPFHAILVSVPRKSNRVESSLAAWLRALSTSCRSSLLTTSNDESAIGYVPFLRSWPFVIRVHLRCRLATRTTPADCPSGQWERTVNPSANAYPGSNPGSATEVRRFPALTTTFSAGAVRSSLGEGVKSGRDGVQIVGEKIAVAVQREVAVLWPSSFCTTFTL